MVGRSEPDHAVKEENGGSPDGSVEATEDGLMV